MKTTPDVILSSEQQTAVDLILGWAFDHPTSAYKGRQEFKLGGYAGTGKTTIMKRVRELLEAGEYLRSDDLDTELDHQRDTALSTCFSSFTGKAVSVLRRKGLSDACTLHSLLYDVHQRDDGSLSWIKRPTIYNEQQGIDDPDIVIVDEASMVSSDLYRDLISHGKKILWVGDPGQLEPVGDNPNLMKEPDYVLQTIYRQAKESSILALADDVRHSRPFFNCRRSDLECIGNTEGESRLLDSDVILVGFNNIRGTLNRKIRSLRGFSGTLNAGERIIVLQNNASRGVFNGQMIEVDEVRYPNDYIVEIDGHDPDTGVKYNGLPLWRPLLEGTVKEADYSLRSRGNPLKCPRKDWVQADYGYVLTCHKSQGSEWDTVMVFEPSWWGKDPAKPMFDQARWRYTAITRASKKLIYCRR